MKNNDSISQHGLFCFTKGPGGWRGAAGWEVCGGSANVANVADVGGDRVRDGHYGQDWAQLASGRCSGPPGAVITRNKM